MVKSRNAAALCTVVVIIAAVGLYLLFFSGRAQQNRQLALIIGIGTHGNISSEAFALEKGARYFRTDITLAPQQITQISNESASGKAQYLGILDYETIKGKNWTLGEWNITVANAVKEYKNITAWEIWNQPWYLPFQTGLVNGSAYNYYLITKAAYLAIKAADQGSIVVCFGGAPIADYNTFIWYEQAWNYGMGRYCDAISIHAYPGLPFNQTEMSVWRSYLSAYENMTGKPIWITETGLPVVAGQISQAAQAGFLEDDIDFFANLSYVKRVYWYDLWGMSGQYDYGLLNSSDPQHGKPNDAWQVFLSLYNDSRSAG